MNRIFKLLIIPKDRVLGGPPELSQKVDVEADNIDGLRAVARDQVAAEGLHLRCVSLGETEVIAYAEVPS